jgi:hypothetical protein
MGVCQSTLLGNTVMRDQDLSSKAIRA